MNISWNITDKDIQKIKKVLVENENPFLIKRSERNVQRQNIVINEDIIIKTKELQAANSLIKLFAYSRLKSCKPLIR